MMGILSYPAAPTVFVNCVLWLDAADAATMFSDSTGLTAVVNNDSVQNWNDKSGQNNHAIAVPSGSSQTYQVGLVNGHSVIRSLGTPGLAMQLTGNTKPLKNCTEFTMVTVLNASNVSNTFAPFFARGANDVSWMVESGVTWEFLGCRVRTNVNPSVASYGLCIYHIVGSQATNTTTIYINNKAKATATFSNDSMTLWDNTIGWYPGWKNFIGTLCELIVFNKALTDSTNPPINGLLQGLADKWGVTL
jgi:hypothetical protein